MRTDRTLREALRRRTTARRRSISDVVRELLDPAPLNAADSEEIDGLRLFSAD